MACFCIWLLQMAVELSCTDATYLDLVSKFLIHFLDIASSINRPIAELGVFLFFNSFCLVRRFCLCFHVFVWFHGFCLFLRFMFGIFFNVWMWSWIIFFNEEFLFYKEIKIILFQLKAFILFKKIYKKKFCVNSLTLSNNISVRINGFVNLLIFIVCLTIYLLQNNLQWMTWIHLV